MSSERVSGFVGEVADSLALAEVGEEEFQRRERERRELVRSFLAGEVGLDELGEESGRLEGLRGDEGVFEVLYPGILYGLVRGLFDIRVEEARAMAEEEKAHFQAAVEDGLPASIVLRSYVISKSEKAVKLGVVLRVIVGIPGGVSEEELRRSLVRFYEAPEVPSEGDLAVLGNLQDED